MSAIMAHRSSVVDHERLIFSKRRCNLSRKQGLSVDFGTYRRLSLLTAAGNTVRVDTTKGALGMTAILVEDATETMSMSGASSGCTITSSSCTMSDRGTTSSG